MAEAATEKQLSALANMLLLQQRLREAQNVAELGFVLANDTQSLVKYRSAVVWRCAPGDRKKGSVVSVAGAVDHDSNSPYLQWMKRVVPALIADAGLETRSFKKDDIPEVLAMEWDKHGSAFLHWLPLVSGSGLLLGGLLLWRDTALKESEQRILANWVSAAGYSLGAVTGRAFSRTPFVWTRRKKQVLLGIAVVFGLLLLLPVRLSVLAQAEIIAKSPLVIKSPLDGIVSELYVRPNVLVEEGDKLLSLDDTQLQTRLEVAKQAYAISRAQYQQASQSASRDINAKASLRVLALEAEKRKAEVTYVESLLERSVVKAKQAGVIMMPSPDQLIGKPVTTGEKMMTVANPDNTQLEAWVAVGDDVDLPLGAVIDFFPNVAPDKKFTASLKRMDYRAEVGDTGELSYRVRGEFDDQQNLPRIGMRGTAKIYGEDVSLGYFLFRRPLAVVRRWIGF